MILLNRPAFLLVLAGIGFARSVPDEIPNIHWSRSLTGIWRGAVLVSKANPNDLYVFSSNNVEKLSLNILSTEDGASVNETANPLFVAKNPKANPDSDPTSARSFGVYETDAAGNPVPLQDTLIVFGVDDDGAKYEKVNRFVAYNRGSSDPVWTFDASNVVASGDPVFSPDGKITYICFTSSGSDDARSLVVAMSNTKTEQVPPNSTLWEEEYPNLKLRGLALSPDGTTLYAFSADQMYNSTSGLNAVVALSAEDGQELDRYPGNGTTVEGRVITEPVLSITGDAVYGTDDMLGLVKYNSSNLAEGPIWNAMLNTGSIQGTSCSYCRPVISPDDNYVYFHASTRLGKVNATSGEVLWDSSLAHGLPRNTPVLSPEGDALYTAAGNTAYLQRTRTSDGETEWETFKFGGIDSDMSINEDGSILYLGSGAWVFAVDTSITVPPSSSPSETPTQSPSASSAPSGSPSVSPTQSPSASPTDAPTQSPSVSSAPSASPSSVPTLSAAPSARPTKSNAPSSDPTPSPTPSPTTGSPSVAPVTSGGSAIAIGFGTAATALAAVAAMMY